jgi:hypothetical protein
VVIDATFVRQQLPRLPGMTTSRSRRVFAGTLILAAAPAAVLLAAAPSSAGAARPTHPVLPAASTRSGALSDVSVAPRSTTAYALGTHTNSSGSGFYALRRHGGGWKTVKIQKENLEQLTSVAAGSSTSAWIAGSYYTKNGTAQKPLIEHSKGSRFTRVTAKLPDGQISGLAASSKKNAWATGSTTAGGPFAAHWNGHRWKSIAISANTFGALGAVSTTSSKNVWALTNVNGQAASAHWNGKRWSIATVAPAADVIAALASSSAKNAWAVGYTYGTKGAKTVTIHWNGKHWLKVASPSPGTSAMLQSVTLHGHSGYAVGSIADKTGLKTTPLVLKLSGKKWKVEHVAKRGQASALYSVSMSSKAAAAVGAWYVHPPCTAHATPANPFVVSPHGSTWGQVSAPEVVPAIASC